MIQSQSAKLVDPFQGVSILCLNPRTFRDSEGSLKSNDLEAIHQHMTAMALQNPEKYFEEASSVLNGGLEFLSNKENEADLKENKNPREKRPALARKRAKFSMKPDTSQPHTIAEPSFQFDSSQGPEEFFAAYEKFENTVKELKRQRGEDANEAKIPTTVRQRRPELPRRKVSYRHHIYSSQPENDTSFSQETTLDNIGSPPTRYSRQESVNPDCQSKEEQVAGSVTKTEDRVNELFDELMSSDVNKLDLLKDRLKIKTVDINDLRLPDFHEIPKVDLVSSVNISIKDLSILPSTHTSPDGLRGRTPVKYKKLSENPFLPLSSPKSPFLAISTLGKHISKSIESNDPFSTHDIVSFPTTNSKFIDEHSTHVSKDIDSLGSGSLHSLVKNIAVETRVHENISAEALINSPECHNMEERDVDDNGAGSYVVTDIQTSKHNMEERDVDDNGAGSYVVTDIQTTKDIQENVEHITTDIYIGDPHCIQVREDNVEDVTHKTGSSTSCEVNVEVSATEDLNTHCSQSVETDANSVEDLNPSRPEHNPDIVPEHPDEEQEHLKTTLEKRDKSRRGRKVDLKKRRQSLAEAGTFYNSGVRRSNRIRRKPLEFWKGERLLYGRIHNSLPTVIGVKYLSSTNNGDPGFKVESFVDAKYKDLVEFAALH